MIDEKRLGEIRERDAREPHWWCPNCLCEVHPQMVRFNETHDREGCGQSVEWVDGADPDVCDLLSALDEAEADNAAIYRALHSHAIRTMPDVAGWFCTQCRREGISASQLEHKQDCFLMQQHPGTALLARHKEELRAKDGEIAHLQTVVADVNVEYNKLLNISEASLSRAREALREVGTRGITHNPNNGMRNCFLCKGEWYSLNSESHNPVTLNGIAGKCPAAPEEGK